LVLAMMAVPPALAGTIPLQWDPSAEEEVQGYYVYWGSGPDDYSPSRRIYTTSTTFDLNLADCPSSPHYVSVKAWNGFSESLQFADEIAGFPRAALIEGSQSPSELALPQPGETENRVEVRVSGQNFRSGSTVGFRVVSGSGVSVEADSARVVSCTQVAATLIVSDGATPGATVTVEVSLDGIPQELPTGTLTYADPRDYEFTIVEASTDFAVMSATPTAESTDVDPGTTVQVLFNRSLDPSKVTGKRFKVKRVGPPGRPRGKARLAPGSPYLESDGRTVTMVVEGALAGNERYAAFVKGGGKGVKDVDGNTLPGKWQQVPGFVTRAFLEGISYGDSPESAGSALVPSGEVPMDSVIVVEFSEPVAASSLSSTNPMIKWPKNGKIPLAGGTPRLSDDGRSIILEPAGILPAGSNLKVIVKGGTKGVKSTRGVILTENKITTGFTTPVGSVSAMGVAE
jgi:hypothetical protein